MNRLCIRRLLSQFTGQRDRFGGVSVYSGDYAGLGDIGSVLKRSLSEWHATGVRGLWFHVSGDETVWIPELLRNGFYCHHAKGDQVVLVKWLPEWESSGIPDYPSTYIGCGTITLDQESNKILAIKEKVRWYNNWKFPGGYVDAGENILDAAVREVKEETGVDTEPVGIVGFRHVLPQVDIPFPAHGCSDIYGTYQHMFLLLTPFKVICALKPKVGGNTAIVKQEREISEAEWIPVDQFLEAGSGKPIVKVEPKFNVGKQKSTIPSTCEHIWTT